MHPQMRGTHERPTEKPTKDLVPKPGPLVDWCAVGPLTEPVRRFALEQPFEPSGSVDWHASLPGTSRLEGLALPFPGFGETTFGTVGQVVLVCNGVPVPVWGVQAWAELEAGLPLSVH